MVVICIMEHDEIKYRDIRITQSMFFEVIGQLRKTKQLLDASSENGTEEHLSE